MPPKPGQNTRPESRRTHPGRIARRTDFPNAARRKQGSDTLASERLLSEVRASGISRQIDLLLAAGFQTVTFGRAPEDDENLVFCELVTKNKTFSGTTTHKDRTAALERALEQWVEKEKDRCQPPPNAIVPIAARQASAKRQPAPKTPAQPAKAKGRSGR